MIDVDFRVRRVRKLLPMELHEIGLLPPTCHCLRSAHITTIWALVQKTESELLAIPGFSPPMLNEVLEAMARLNLRPGMRKNLTPRYELAQKLARQAINLSP